jgi:tripartite-type tricarboxylate transporter receptor subunit TctC
MMRRRGIGCVAFALLATTANITYAQNGYPARPVRIIVPTAAGAGLDSLARLLARSLSEKAGKQFVIDNRAGAGGAIGMELGAHAAPDGYTLVMFTLTHLATSTIPSRQSVDIVRDFAPVSWVSSMPYLLNVHPTLPAKSIPELISLAKARPGTLAYGSTGNGSIQHLAGVMFSKLSGARLLHVPYKGGALVITDVVSGQIQMSFTVYPACKPHIEAGRMRALGVTTSTRVSALPNLPAIAETLPEFEIDTWYGIVAPAKTPAPILDWLNREVSSILHEPELGRRLAADTIEVKTASRQEFGRYLAAEVTTWSAVVRDAAVRNE